MPIEVQARDIALMRGLFESRLMTLAHASALYFDGKNEATKKRVQKLKAAGLIRERSRRLYEPSILYLAKKGYFVLFEQGHIADYPRMTWEKLEDRLQVSDLTLRHELSVMDVKMAFATAIREQQHLSLAEFTTWPKLIEFNAFHPATGATVIVKPDGFIRIHETEADGGKSEHLFFLEVDRSTETLETIVNRVHCYLQFYKRGGLAKKFGYEAEAFKEFPFRVLIVCKSEERRDNIAKRLIAANPPIKTFAFLAVASYLHINSIGAKWITPEMYADNTRANTLKMGLF